MFQANDAFENILYILDDISAIPELQWDYHMPFSGLAKYLQEEHIKNYAEGLGLLSEKRMDGHSTLRTSSGFRRFLP